MKHFFCTILALFAFALFLFTHSVSAAESLTLAKDGKTDHVIVLPVTSTAVESTAAKELQSHLGAVTGANFAIVNEVGVDATKPQIIVGNSKRLKELLPDLDISKIPYDGIVIKTVGNNLVLVGHPQRGTLYAVYSFLEDTVGVRWWTSTESYIPKKPTLQIPPQNVEYAPKLIYREAYYRDAFEGVFASRMKCNGNMSRVTPEYGGHHRFFHFVHSFFPLIPPDKYFEQHPEWYSEINGQRKHDHAQLCLTNDEMRAELTKNALEGLRQNPGATYISISQNDWRGNCTCEKCKAIDDEEGSPAGSLLRFVNKVAEDIEKEFPDIWVETLAYQYTRKPPKFVTPRKNVVIRLCTIECCFFQPLGEGEHNKSLREDIQGWSKIADSLFIWDYTVNFSAYMLPHPNHRVLGPNVRFFVDHNTIGLFEQGDAHCTAGDFARVKNWVLSQMMWDQSRDADKLYDEFILGYYGPDAGPIVKEYLTLLHDRAEQANVYLGCFRVGTEWLDMATLLKAHALMEKAVASAKDDTICNRLRRDKMPIDLVILRDYHALRRKAEAMGQSASLPSNPKALADNFAAQCKEFGVTHYWEWDGSGNMWDHGRGLTKVLDGFQKKFASDASAAPPEFCKNLPKTSWCDIQSFEFNLHKDGELTFPVDDAKASNKRAVKMPGDHHEWATSYPFDSSLLDLTPKEPATQSPESGDVVPGSLEYRLYAAVRCEAKEGVTGPAMTLGVYDPDEKKGVTYKALTVEEIGGSEYRWIDLGAFPIRPTQYVWFAPPKRPGDVEAVYVDRIVVVRER